MRQKFMNRKISLMIFSCWTLYNNLIKSAVVFISKLTTLYPSWYVLIKMCNDLNYF